MCILEQGEPHTSPEAHCFPCLQGARQHASRDARGEPWNFAKGVGQRAGNARRNASRNASSNALEAFGRRGESRASGVLWGQAFQAGNYFMAGGFYTRPGEKHAQYNMSSNEVVSSSCPSGFMSLKLSGGLRTVQTRSFKPPQLLRRCKHAFLASTKVLSNRAACWAKVRLKHERWQSNVDWS